MCAPVRRNPTTEHWPGPFARGLPPRRGVSHPPARPAASGRLPIRPPRRPRVNMLMRRQPITVGRLSRSEFIGVFRVGSITRVANSRGVRRDLPYTAFASSVSLPLFSGGAHKTVKISPSKADDMTAETQPKSK